MDTFIDRDTLRVNPITPFTYRDGLTFLEVLEQLRIRDVELCNQINDGLAEAADNLEAAIKGLLEDLESSVARIDGFQEEMDRRFALIVDRLSGDFSDLEARLLGIVEKALLDKTIDVFSYHVGKTVKLPENIALDDNHYADHGLTAGDYTRKWFSVQEIEDMPYSVEEMAYHGKFVGLRANPRTMYNDHSGEISSVRAQIAVGIETGLSGTGSTNEEAQSLTDSCKSIIERKVR